MRTVGEPTEVSHETHTHTQKHHANGKEGREEELHRAGPKTWSHGAKGPCNSQMKGHGALGPRVGQKEHLGP